MAAYGSGVAISNIGKRSWRGNGVKISMAIVSAKAAMAKALNNEKRNDNSNQWRNRGEGSGEAQRNVMAYQHGMAESINGVAMAASASINGMASAAAAISMARNNGNINHQ